jgi:BRCT domain type II-containing protein
MRTITAAPARVHAAPLNVARRVVSKPGPRRASAPSTRSSDRKSARTCATEMTSTSTTAGNDADLVAEDLDLDAPNPSAIYDVVDEDEMLYGASNTFPIKPDELVAKCKSALRAGFANIGDELAEDFEVRSHHTGSHTTAFAW